MLTLLALTGLSAVLIAMAVFRAGRNPDVLRLALQVAILGALAHGLMLLVSFAAYTALDRARIRILALGGMLLAVLMLLMIPLFTWWEITHILFINRRPALADNNPMQRLAITGLMTASLLCIIPFILAPQMKRIGRIVQFTAILYLS
ncbi:MAG TPA: hypothetical protein VHM90_13250, partial [Phycisphaerae bacterium]|nr:hypothetical protein [Phycisphaerae bacterium]